MKTGTVATLLLLSTARLLAQESVYSGGVTNVGTAAAPFLGIGVGARAIAMGGAFAAVADDASALYWNPAGLSLCRRPEITLNHSDWFLDIYHDYIGMVVPAGRHGFGAALTYLGVPDQAVRTIEQPEGTGDFYNAADLALALSYSFAFTDQFAMGFSAKYIHQRIYHCTAAAGAVDLGALYRPSAIKWLTLGVEIANFGTDLRLRGRDLTQKVDIDEQHNSSTQLPAALDTDAFSLPLTFRFGLAARVLHSRRNSLTAAVDFLHPSNNSESLNLGAEYLFLGAFALRGGYRSLFEQDHDLGGGLTLGAGLKLYAGGALFVLDYAWQSHGILENINRFSCGLRF